MDIALRIDCRCIGAFELWVSTAMGEEELGCGARTVDDDIFLYIFVIFSKPALACFDFDCLTLALEFPWNVTELVHALATDAPLMHRTYGEGFFFVATATAFAAASAVVILIPPTHTHVHVFVYVYTYIYSCSSHTTTTSAMCVSSTIRCLFTLFCCSSTHCN